MKAILLGLGLASAAVGGVNAAVTLHDASRGRDLPLKIYYPDAVGKFPVIVFSHGLGGSKDGYQYLGEAWAAHGYVVLIPTHAGSDSRIFKRGRPLRNLKAARDSTLDPKNWRDRPADVSFLLSSFGELEKMVPALRGKLDADRIGVGGHSFGAYTAAAVAGLAVEIAGQANSFRDNRPRAFLSLSPQGPGDIPASAAGWASVERPFLVITGTKDAGFNGQPPEWRLQAYAHMKPGDKFQAVLRDADHRTFAGRGLAASSTYLDAIRALTLTYWDAFLKENAEAKARLVSGRLAAERHGLIRFEHK